VAADRNHHEHAAVYVGDWRSPCSVAEDRNYDQLLAHFVEVSGRLSATVAEDRN
jgi:hypothetical protein